MASSNKILLTTSRNPTVRIRTFCNDLTRVIPSIVRVNRGKMSIDEVAEKALEYNTNHVLIVDRWQGGLGKIEFFNAGVEGLVPAPPILYVAGISLQREFAPAKLKQSHSLAITHSTLNFMEIIDALSTFFNLPVLLEKEALSDYQVTMHISHDATRRVQITFMLLPQNVEVGPRITIRQAEWEPFK